MYTYTIMGVPPPMVIYCIFTYASKCLTCNSYRDVFPNQGPRVSKVERRIGLLPSSFRLRGRDRRTGTEDTRLASAQPRDGLGAEPLARLIDHGLTRSRNVVEAVRRKEGCVLCWMVYVLGEKVEAFSKGSKSPKTEAGMNLGLSCAWNRWNP